MPVGVMAHGPSEVGDRLAASRHDGPEPQRQEPVIRGGGKSRLKHRQYWHSKRWEPHTLNFSRWRFAWSQSSTALAP